MDTGDNGQVTTLSAGLIREARLAADIERAKKKAGPEALDVSYRLDMDSTGEPSIFFNIVLADWATEEDQLAKVTSRIAATLFDEIRPFENWGLHPYFNYESEAEQQEAGGLRSR